MIHIGGPRINTAGQIFQFAEAHFSQEINGALRPLSMMAVHHDVVRGIKFINAFGNLIERNQFRAGQMRNVPFLRLTYVQQRDFLIRADRFLQLPGVDLLDRRAAVAFLIALAFGVGNDAAETFVIL